MNSAQSSNVEMVDDHILHSYVICYTVCSGGIGVFGRLHMHVDVSRASFNSKSENMAWMSNLYGAITQPCPNFNGDF